MKAKTFLPLIIVGICLRISLICCSPESSSFTKHKLSRSQSSVFYVSGLISDWNQKNAERVNEVVIFDIGKPTESIFDLCRMIPHANPIFLVKPNQCQTIHPREAAFIIIASDIYDRVSEVFLCLFDFCFLKSILHNFFDFELVS